MALNTLFQRPDTAARVNFITFLKTPAIVSFLSLASEMTMFSKLSEQMVKKY